MKWNFLALVLKNVFYFIIFWESETTKNYLYLRKQKPLNASYISENGTFKCKLKKCKIPPRKKNPIFQELKLSCPKKLNKTFFKLPSPKNFIKCFYTSVFSVAYGTPCCPRVYRSHLIFVTDGTQYQARGHHYHFLPNPS